MLSDERISQIDERVSESLNDDAVPSKVWSFLPNAVSDMMNGRPTENWAGGCQCTRIRCEGKYLDITLSHTTNIF